MKTIRKVEEDLWHVTSESGDQRRYDYFVYQSSGGGYYHFMPREGSFKYPQRLNDHRCLAIEKHEDNYARVAEEYDCNPWTLKECVRTVIELQKIKR